MAPQSRGVPPSRTAGRVGNIVGDGRGDLTAVMQSVAVAVSPAVAVRALTSPMEAAAAIETVPFVEAASGVTRTPMVAPVGLF